MDKDVKDFLLTILLVDVSVVVLAMIYYGGEVWLKWLA